MHYDDTEKVTSPFPLNVGTKTPIYHSSGTLFLFNTHWQSFITTIIPIVPLPDIICAHTFNDPITFSDFIAFIAIAIFLLLPDPLRKMGAWRKTMEPQNPGNSPWTLTRGRRETKSRAKSERRKESVAGQGRMKWEVSWVGSQQALQQGFSIMPILER